MSLTDPKPVKFGRYILLDRVNVGGMAEVFRGKMQGVEGFERLVALKRILPNVAQDPDFVEMFVDEAKLAVQLQHANIAQIYDLGKVDDAYYIAMEYVSGVDLRTIWDRARGRNRLLPIAMSCYIMQRTCEGLDAAHRKKAQDGSDLGLVHRDVSPHNILMSYEGEVKVIDFGIAKSKSKISKTQAGVLKGKFGYMSPEQVRGVDLDNRSDVFACGAILYELLVGDRLFLGESDFATLEKVRNVEVIPPTQRNKGLSPDLERIVLRALAKNRDERYQWTSEMAEELQRFLFSSNQPFSRTDLQRYLAQHFKEEMDQEQERLDRYKEITFATFEAEPRAASKPAVAKPAQAVAKPAPAVAPPDDDEGSTPLTSIIESSNAAAANFSAELAPVQITLDKIQRIEADDTLRRNVSSKPRLPTWAATLIGVLGTCAVLGFGLALYAFFGAPARGSITLEVSPNRADIYINDKQVSNASPYTLDSLTPNTYVVMVKKEGYEPLIRAIAIGAGEARYERIELEKRKGTATLVIKTKPEGLSVWLDGADTGRVTPANIAGLNAGDHALLLKNRDKVVTHKQVTIADGDAEIVDVDTAQLPGILEIASEPTGARVAVDGERRGATPVRINPAKLGSTRIVVEKDGCARFETTVVVEPAGVTPVVAKLSNCH